MKRVSVSVSTTKPECKNKEGKKRERGIREGIQKQVSSAVSIFSRLSQKNQSAWGDHRGSWRLFIWASGSLPGGPGGVRVGVSHTHTCPSLFPADDHFPPRLCNIQFLSWDLFSLVVLAWSPTCCLHVLACVRLCLAALTHGNIKHEPPCCCGCLISSNASTRSFMRVSWHRFHSTARDLVHFIVLHLLEELNSN